MPIPRFAAAEGIKDSAYDAVVLVTAASSPDTLPDPFRAHVEEAKSIDSSVFSSPSVIKCSDVAGGRFVLAATGPLNRGIDDVRRISDAAFNGVNRALKAGASAPLIVFTKDVRGSGKTTERYVKAVEVGLLGVADALHVPLQVREAKPESEKVEKVGYVANYPDGEPMKEIADFVHNVEAGRRVARDICGGDPERMAPPQAADYIRQTFKDLPVKIDVVEDFEEIEKEFPCAAAVGRCTRFVPRHRPRIVRMEYVGGDSVEQNLYFVGKGITYDTGGADVKISGSMAGMKMDKGGAATIAGFMMTLALTRPTHVRAVAHLAFVRNSIGAECYVADEIVTARSGRRVLVVNTDAEGRMAMADILTKTKEEILESKLDTETCQVYTVATLTGHAVVSYGNYPAILDNGPARSRRNAEAISALGDIYGDPLEVSRLRREDIDFIAPKNSEYDVLQCNNAPSSRTPRGHQFPFAFLIRVSGLDEHDEDNEEAPIAYTHLDIGGAVSTGPPWSGLFTGRPVAALAARHIFSK